MKDFDSTKLASMVQMIMGTMIAKKMDEFRTGELGTMGSFMDPNTNTIAVGSRNSLPKKDQTHFESETLTGRLCSNKRSRLAL